MKTFILLSLFISVTVSQTGPIAALSLGQIPILLTPGQNYTTGFRTTSPAIGSQFFIWVPTNISTIRIGWQRNKSPTCNSVAANLYSALGSFPCRNSYDLPNQACTVGNILTSSNGSPQTAIDNAEEPYNSYTMFGTRRDLIRGDYLYFATDYDGGQNCTATINVTFTYCTANTIVSEAYLGPKPKCVSYTNVTSLSHSETQNYAPSSSSYQKYWLLNVPTNAAGIQVFAKYNNSVTGSICARPFMGAEVNMCYQKTVGVSNSSLWISNPLPGDWVVSIQFNYDTVSNIYYDINFDIKTCPIGYSSDNQGNCNYPLSQISLTTFGSQSVAVPTKNIGSSSDGSWKVYGLAVPQWTFAFFNLTLTETSTSNMVGAVYIRKNAWPTTSIYDTSSSSSTIFNFAPEDFYLGKPTTYYIGFQNSNTALTSAWSMSGSYTPAGPSPSPSVTPSPSPSPSTSPSSTSSPTRTPSPTPSPTTTPSPSSSPPTSPSPTASMTPTSSPTTSMTPSSSLSPTPTTTPSATVSPTASASSSPTPVPEPKSKSQAPIIAGSVAGGGALLLILSVVLVIFFRKRKNQGDTLQPIELSPKQDSNAQYALTNQSGHYVPVASSSKSSVYIPMTPPGLEAASVAERMSFNQNWAIKYSDIQLEKQIGKGAFGVVYKGIWKGIDVAVKQLLAENDTPVDDFFAEADLMTKLRPHPNITQTLGMCASPPCLVTEFVHNGSLLSYLRNEKPTLDQMFNIAKGVALGMLYLHSEGVIHRDLAARNILLDKTMSPKVSDFGMSRVALDDKTHKTTSDVGPIRWMPPEALRNRIYNTKTDVWSYGIVLYEILAQKTPYHGYDLMQVAGSVMAGELSLIPEIEQHREEYPEVVVNVLKACLRMNPEERPSFEEIVEMLKSS